jgi:hypothetical protein
VKKCFTGSIFSPTRSAWGDFLQLHPIEFGCAGSYPAHIIEIGEVRAGARDLTLQLGDALLHMRTDPAFGAKKLCRVAIDPQALQVWTVD